MSDSLLLLRKFMSLHNVDIYIIPMSDQHNSEYVPSQWKRIQYLCGFSGSSGDLIVTQEHAFLWTDGRYFLQAEVELDPKFFKLMKLDTEGYPSIYEWLKNNAINKNVSIDPKVITVSRFNLINKYLSTINNSLNLIEKNLIDSVQQSLNCQAIVTYQPIYYLSIEYTGEEIKSKLNYIKSYLQNNNIDFYVTNTLDLIAWIYNIRGNDILYNPLPIAYTIITKNESYLFLNNHELENDTAKMFKSININILNYIDFEVTLRAFKGVCALDYKTVNINIFNILNDINTVKDSDLGLTLLKSIKNSSEIEGAINAHIKDGVAIIKFLVWLEHNWMSKVDELSCMQKLFEFRQSQQNFVGNSFNTISSFGSNSAIIHYAANQRTNKIVDNSNIYLLDSGGQYLDGTTDITRTIHLGNPTDQQKNFYTLVLKGHLAISRLKFPHGTKGENIDVMARAPLWDVYQNYNHGTGHGVGSFLCVHEGPQRISQHPSNVALLPGMIVSNEPGYYIDGEYGIRIENLIYVTHDQSKKATMSKYGKFYNFQNLTMVPYCKKLINVKLLNDQEKEQIASYNEKILLVMKNKLEPKEFQWLKNEVNIL